MKYVIFTLAGFAFFVFASAAFISVVLGDILAPYDLDSDEE